MSGTRKLFILFVANLVFCRRLNTKILRCHTRLLPCRIEVTLAVFQNFHQVHNPFRERKLESFSRHFKALADIPFTIHFSLRSKLLVEVGNSVHHLLHEFNSFKIPDKVENDEFVLPCTESTTQLLTEYTENTCDPTECNESDGWHVDTFIESIDCTHPTNGSISESCEGGLVLIPSISLALAHF